MFHIVFDKRGAELISEAMDMDEALDGEIISINDDYSIGPIENLHNEEGRFRRINWWNSILPDSKYSATDRNSEISDDIKLRRIIHRMEEEEFDEIWIWVAPNAKDVCGYYWLITQVGKFSGRVYILSLNNLPFIGEKGNIFYPASLAEIPVREFVKAKKLARKVSPTEFELDPEEWLRITSEGKNLRLAEGVKKINPKEDDYFDVAILHSIQPSYQKIIRATQLYLSKSSEKVNELFVLWRLRHLIASGLIEQKEETIRLMVKSPDEVNG
jgi:hypothetical protein